jgi:hypothetical protein
VKEKERREGVLKPDEVCRSVGHWEGERGEEIEQIHEGHKGPPFQYIIMYNII